MIYEIESWDITFDIMDYTRGDAHVMVSVFPGGRDDLGEEFGVEIIMHGVDVDNAERDIKLGVDRYMHGADIDRLFKHKTF